MNYKHILPGAATTLLLMIATLMPVRATAQSCDNAGDKQDGYFVLTNGKEYSAINYSTARPNTEDEVEIGYIERNGRWVVWTDGRAATDTTYSRVTGTIYLELDISGGGARVAQTTTFSPYCVWKRSSSGYLSQDWDGYRYYLTGESTNPAGYTHKLYVKKVPISNPSQQGVAIWENWDFGAAVTETFEYAGGGSGAAYYWLAFDATLDEGAGAWTLSCNSYNRPEALKYLSETIHEYYCSIGSGAEAVPACNGALTMPINYERHEKEVSNAGAGVGLTDVTLSTNELKFGQTATATTTFVAGTVQVIPAYTYYREERESHFMNTNWRNRCEENVRNSKGEQVFAHHYYWDANPTVDQAAAPDPEPEDLTLGDIVSYTYTLDNKSRRYLAVTNNGASATLECVNVPATNIIATLTVTLTYSNGTQQSLQRTLTVKPGVDKAPKDPENAPVVRGNVFGGGRMAPVNGNTVVTIHNCDTISAVFGGNDISGRVSGADGSAVTLGSSSTTSAAGVHIGSVYGGGNGFYNYQYVAGEGTVDFVEGTEMGPKFKGSVWTWESTEDGDLVATGFTGDSVPEIKKTAVTVYASDYVFVDSLFGGAKNAFVVNTVGNSVTLTNNGGTVYAEFGGNNYGGSIGTGSTISININGTKVKDENNTFNTYDGGFGREFGIRYLFGGGNMVLAPTVNMTIAGGMVDTCFAGGNSATVTATSCLVNCTGGNSYFTNTTETDHWVGGKHRYNVRCLFGGNNLADMTIMPTLTLTSGGIGTVYGGGNMGAMRANTTPTSAITSLFTDSYIESPKKVGTYVQVTSNNMKIDYLYGGCRMADVTNATFVHMTGGQVGTLFGGSNIGGDIGGTTADSLGTYTVISGGTVMANVFGGSNGYYHCNAAGRYISGTNFTDNDSPAQLFDYYDDYIGLNIPTHQNTHLLITGGTVKGNVYGGANLANVGYTNTRIGKVRLTMAGGTVKGNLYGGGNMASISGLSNLFIQGSSTIEGSLFAGNDRVGAVETYTAEYKIPSGGSYIQGAGFLATDGTTQLNVFEDGHYQAKYSTYVRITDHPTIHFVYGGGNGAYNYDGLYPQYGDELLYCPTADGTTRPIQSSAFIDLNPGPGASIDTVFGGGNGVSVRDNVVVLFNAVDTAGVYVNTIFGGNNRDTMPCVPDIRLHQGKVKSVYGGGNSGVMSGSRNFTDICSNTVRGVSSYVVVEEAMAVIDTIYGGCNQSNVTGMAYIDIRNTGKSGVKYVYGGNNISGTVEGNTRIDVSNGVVHNIYGGSNGYYTYDPIGDNDYRVYKYGTNNVVALHSTGSPVVSCAKVNIFGGTINNDVYGGGRMGDCDTTYVVVNDTVCGRASSAVINGVVYGGGEGNHLDLNEERRGNVTGETHVDLYHALLLSGAEAYGGGKGGDVMHTYLTVHPAWEQRFDNIYGGCWGSDVHGIAHVLLDGKESGEAYNADNVFGGNDRTGNVYRSEVTVNSGRYGYIYGAGNGDYEASWYTSSPYNNSDKKIYVPNNESVQLTINGGLVENNVYGGGKLGTTFSYQRDANDVYVLVDGKRVADTATTTATAFTTNPKASDYASIVVNMHGGTVNGNVYTGAQGAEGIRCLVYGLKVLNIDGDAEVKVSIYGGSQSVSDGYPHECTDNVIGTSTTKRPSSIINVAGGTIRNRVYGAGFFGNTYGSTYVNLGLHAIDTCPVWTASFGSDSTYYGFKPSLTASDLMLGAEVFGGANWGDNTGGSDFRVRGYFGGESRIIIDGIGYKTDSDPMNLDPEFFVEKSIIGSGTSTEGGDVLNHIEIHNFGTLSNECRATKTIKSIQRADELYLQNTAINYSGASDASRGYASSSYSMLNLGSINMRGFNLAEIEKIVDNVDTLRFLENDRVNNEFDTVRRLTLNTNTLTSVACNERQDHCDELSVIHPVDRKYSLLLNMSGYDINIYRTADNGAVTYGLVLGYGYYMAAENKDITVVARPKTNEINPHDGGFSATCLDSNRILEDPSAADNENWATCEQASCQSKMEYVYINHNTGAYRTWSTGHGLRRRSTTVLAHNVPDSLDVDKMVLLTTCGDNQKLAIATAQLVLPPSRAGHYYKLIENSFVLSGESEFMTLVDTAWKANDWAHLSNNWDDVVGNGPNTLVGREGDFIGTPSETGSHPMGVQRILDNPGNTFGMMIAAGNKFSNTMPEDHEGANPYTVVSGNNYVNYTGVFCTPMVDEGGGANTSPIIDIYMLYSPDFASTFLGTVTFKFGEFYHDGEGEHQLDADIEAQIIVSTIIHEFTDIKTEVLAMYNEGRSNHFTRKVVLPATNQTRDLYMTSVKWVPTDVNGNELAPTASTDNKFYLAEEESTVTGAALTPDPVINRFCVSIRPADNVSSTVESSMGWSTKDVNEVNIFTMADQRQDYAYDTMEYSKLTAGVPDSVLLRDLNGGFGLKIGQLDGRALAVINVDLTFDGNRTYEALLGKGYVGKVVIGFESRYANKLQGKTFYMTVYVKTRAHGDTIYLASDEGPITRTSSDGLHEHTIHAYNPHLSNSDPNYYPPEDEGKYPNCYVRTFQDALSSRVYQEGDVIAIIDKVTIGNESSTTITGMEYAAIPVIRYTGHHWQMPGEEGVYRGTMIEVSGAGAYLNAKCIDFDGGAVGKITPTNAAGTVLGEKVDDTNRVFGPIIALKNGGTMTFSTGGSMNNNWNEYTGDDASLKGAISLTKTISGYGTLILQHNITIANNLSHDFNAIDHPANGAIYVDGGQLKFAESSEQSAVNITKNYLIPAQSVPADPNDRDLPEWCAKYPNADSPMRWMIDTNYLYHTNWKKANVFLTRTAGSPDAVMNDTKTDAIPIVAGLSENTRVGISKWFPGDDPLVRDTIRFAELESQNTNHMKDAVNRGNFISDEGWNILYAREINADYIYLHRCATFKFQRKDQYLPYPLDTPYGDTMLVYHPLLEATCPTGGDSIICRVQGGFFPYTYTWSGSETRERRTNYSNIDVMKDISHSILSSYKHGIADTLYTSPVAMTQRQVTDTLIISVSANDVTGFCELKKNMKIVLVKETERNDFAALEKQDPVAAWTNTVSPGDTMRALRNYPAVKITPMVWADRSLGTIEAQLANYDTVYTEDAYGQHPLNDLSFCEGDILTLGTASRRDNEGNPVSKFIMWDFDPYYGNPVKYVVPARSTSVIAYYGPLDYWVDVINDVDKAGSVYDDNYYYTNRPTVAGYTSTCTDADAGNAGYVTTYNGDVHIYDENGLAWFISVVNGLNGTQARPFYFNNVYLHKKSNGTDYDMKAHQWTPVGTIQHRFRGRFIGVEGKDREGNDLTATTIDSCTTPAITPIIIKNIIVNEPNLENCGFFAWLDSATVKGIELQSAFVRGSQYVGTLAARSVDSKVDNCIIKNNLEGDVTTTILTAHHTSGGMIGKSENDVITNSQIYAKYVGDAVYSGGVVGYGTSSTITNTSLRNDNRMEGLYIGGLAGWLDGVAPYGAKSNGYATVQNNYVHLITDGRSQRVGGLVGYATNSLIENNYVHGTVLGSATEGGIGAVLDAGSWSDHNYYEQKAVDRTYGQRRGNAMVAENTDFNGQGNQVQLSTATYGVNNLTRVLNLWVRQHGSEYNTWRSDLENTNYGYPLFGEPDLIPVHEEFTYEGCDSIEWDGLLYNESTVLTSHVIDSLLMIDSTSTLTLVVHHSTYEQYTDSTILGQDYAGHGFEISAEELNLLRLTVNHFGSATVVLTDTLTSATGCDSIVSLSLTVTKGNGIVDATPTDIKVYPNPTTSRVTIETDGLSHVELYDNEGRRLQDYTTGNQHDITIDVSSFATGVYYLRIHKGNDVTIQKLIKK